MIPSEDTERMSDDCSRYFCVLLPASKLHEPRQVVRQLFPAMARSAHLSWFLVASVSGRIYRTYTIHTRRIDTTLGQSCREEPNTAWRILMGMRPRRDALELTDCLWADEWSCSHLEAPELSWTVSLATMYSNDRLCSPQRMRASFQQFRDHTTLAWRMRFECTGRLRLGLSG